MTWGEFRCYLIEANKRLSGRGKAAGSTLREFDPPSESDVDGLPWVPPDMFPEEWDVDG